MSDFEQLLREQTMREWRDLDQIHPHAISVTHVSSRVMRTYHTCPQGVRSANDDQKCANK